jgi:hypothetical protein
MLRAKGINNLGEGDYVIFEPGGAVSVVSASVLDELSATENARE